MTRTDKPIRLTATEWNALCDAVAFAGTYWEENPGRYGRRMKAADKALNKIRTMTPKVISTR